MLSVAGCESKQDRKTAQKSTQAPTPSPESTTSASPTASGEPGNGGNNVAGNNGAGAVGDASYMTPRSRPNKVKTSGSDTPRDVTENDVFVTPVYLDSTSWLKICANIVVEGISTPFLVGCTHEATAPDSGTNQAAAQNPKFVLDSPLTVGLSSGGKRLKMEFQIYAQENNSGCGANGCPGPFTKKISSKSTESAPSSIKCLKAGNVLVLFVEDKTDKDVATDSEFRGKLTADSGSEPVPRLPNLRNLHDPQLLSAMYTDASNYTKISEKDVRRKYGVDFDDLILQVDLGTSGHKLAGYESCN